MASPPHGGDAAATLAPGIRRAPTQREETQPRLPRWLRALLAVPLIGKLVGANVIIAAAAVAVALGRHAGMGGERPLVALLVCALVGALLVNLLLVWVALRPIEQLESTADRVWQGDLAARVPPSALADRDMQRVGRTINLLLDGLTSDRERMRHLAAQVISAGDAERSRIARELHDSTAQSLAALAYQVSAAARDSRDAELAQRLGTIRELTASVLEEVRLLAHTVYPRVLDDLGLPAALQNLARQAGERDPSVTIDVDAEPAAARLPATVAAVLYRVAQEAITNALRHAAPRGIHVRVAMDRGTVRLEIADDGRGFDVQEAEHRRPGMGLFSMRERVSLVDGTFEVTSAPGAGTRVRAAIAIPTQTTPPSQS